MGDRTGFFRGITEKATSKVRDRHNPQAKESTDTLVPLLGTKSGNGKSDRA